MWTRHVDETLTQLATRATYASMLQTELVNELMAPVLSLPQTAQATAIRRLLPDYLVQAVASAVGGSGDWQDVRDAEVCRAIDLAFANTPPLQPVRISDVIPLLGPHASIATHGKAIATQLTKRGWKSTKRHGARVWIR